MRVRQLLDLIDTSNSSYWSIYIFTKDGMGNLGYINNSNPASNVPSYILSEVDIASIKVGYESLYIRLENTDVIKDIHKILKENRNENLYNHPYTINYDNEGVMMLSMGHINPANGEYVVEGIYSIIDGAVKRRNNI